MGDYLEWSKGNRIRDQKKKSISRHLVAVTSAFFNIYVLFLSLYQRGITCVQAVKTVLREAPPAASSTVPSTAFTLVHVYLTVACDFTEDRGKSPMGGMSVPKI